ncbi:OapC/ArvC family zinc-ribbon domain-containing protein [Halapricum hydrolyticum]|uniref:Zn-ribbon domain-containing protein n=1 Tax=Halapricum hydrolyticum TaxID=2979991 RepID=A0AAE3ICR0_9EURY|nr:Zn-ribbon containing protein [Halapricum hydrolyticum]MCU4718885.1 Zn-ribbon domain-containing protein [Halapricum hydrolyticum]MCU4727837.1 Zn-ribbon domain-containing protein [Halapricum hydrolyticum]
MPHQCTSCGHVFEDGSKEMLSGCPDCGGTKFQFHPEGADIPERPPGDVDPPDRPEPDDSVAGAVGNAAATVRDLVGGTSTGNGGVSPTENPPVSGNEGVSTGNKGDRSIATESENVGGVALDDGGSTPADTSADRSQGTSAGGFENTSDGESENAAQASARSDVVSRDELPDSPAESPDSDRDNGTVVQEPDEADRPDLSELREELNDQFESIKVVEPGQYELNLMELYDREEYIIALQEDGKYSIQVPDRWQD